MINAALWLDVAQPDRAAGLGPAGRGTSAHHDHPLPKPYGLSHERARRSDGFLVWPLPLHNRACWSLPRQGQGHFDHSCSLELARIPSRLDARLTNMKAATAKLKSSGLPDGYANPVCNGPVTFRLAEGDVIEFCLLARKRHLTAPAARSFSAESDVILVPRTLLNGILGQCTLGPC